MTNRLGLVLLLLTLLGSCDDDDDGLPPIACPCDAATPDAPDEGTRRCSEDGDSIEAFENGAWQVVGSCGEGDHCASAICVCDPGSRCTGASTAESCCGNDTEPPVGPEGCYVAPDDDNLRLPMDRPLAIQSGAGVQICSSPAGSFRLCGPSSTCTEAAEGEEPEVYCACTPSEGCMPIECAEGTFQVTVECPAEPQALPIYHLCDI